MGLNLLLLSKQVSLFPRRRRGLAGRAPGSGKGQIVAEAANANAFRIIRPAACARLKCLKLQPLRPFSGRKG